MSKIPRELVHVGSCGVFTKIFNNFSDVPIIAYLWAEWCQPCKSVTPVFKLLSEKYSGRALFLKVNADLCTDVLQQFKTTAVPTFLVFRNWNEVDRITGAPSYPALESFIQRAIQQ